MKLSRYMIECLKDVEEKGAHGAYLVGVYDRALATRGLTERHPTAKRLSVLTPAGKALLKTDPQPAPVKQKKPTKAQIEMLREFERRHRLKPDSPTRYIGTRDPVGRALRDRGLIERTKEFGSHKISAAGLEFIRKLDA